MTADMMKAAQLRAALSKYRERTRYGKYPLDLHQRAVAYCLERSRAGASLPEIVSELGVRDDTVKLWASAAGKPASRTSRTVTQAAPEVSLVPVVIRSQSTAARLTRLEVEFPDGTRLVASGVGGRELVDAIESLRRSQ